jgi:hypothetical protein
MVLPLRLLVDKQTQAGVVVVELVVVLKPQVQMAVAE